MKPTEDNTTETEAMSAALGLQHAAQGFSAIRDLLAAIVVLDEYHIADIYGNTYTFRPVLAARRQIEAALRIDTFVRRNMSADGLQAAQEAKASGGVMAGVTAFLTRCVEIPEVQDDLQSIFGAIHPEILKQAQASSPDGVDHVLDMFELADLLEALVPFFARSATRIAGVLSTMAAAESPRSSQASQPMPSAK